MTVKQNKTTGSWEYSFMYKGLRYHRCFKGATKKEVATYEAIAKSELIKNQYDIARQNTISTVSEIIEDYKADVDIRCSRPKEAKVIIDRFYKLIGKNFAKDVTLQDINHYVAYRKRQKCRNKKTNVTNSSINRELDCIKRCFSLAKINRKIQENPFDNFCKLTTKNPTKRFLEKEEEVKLLEASSLIMRIIIIVALHTGMRCGEIKNLKWSDVFLEQGYLIALNTKNGKSRKLIITPQMKKDLKLLPRLSEYVFTNPITKTKYKDFKSTFARTVKRAQIPKITFHELRHTTASRMNEIGIDLATIQEYLDHSDAKTTQKYIHKPRKNIVDAINKLAQY